MNGTRYSMAETTGAILVVILFFYKYLTAHSLFFLWALVHIQLFFSSNIYWSRYLIINFDILQIPYFHPNWKYKLLVPSKLNPVSLGWPQFLKFLLIWNHSHYKKTFLAQTYCL